MKRPKIRPIILILISIAALLLPGPHYESVISMYIIPLLLGASVAFTLSDRHIALRLGLVVGIAALVALTRLIWGAIVLDGGDFSFDEEIDLVIVGIILEIFASFVGFWFTWLAWKRCRTIA